MRRLLIAALLALVASSAAALNVDELLSTIAMPLAVATVSDLNGVPQDNLATFVTELNQANVPPTQFVEIVRYVPVALVPQPNQRFVLVQYTQDQIAQGVTGDALVNAIAQQLATNFNINPDLALSAPPTTIVETTDFIPQPVIAQVGGFFDPVALVSMPLAVAAASDISGVPTDQLANLVMTLNNANVPPMQVVQIVRFAPVALVDNGPQFVQFVQQQTSQGIVGPALVPVVTQQLQTFFPPPAQVELAPQIVTTAPAPVTTITPEPPPVVVSRIAEMQRNPHGGPPGLIKKQLGLQTGAEVVHGFKPGRQFTPPPAVAVAPPAPPVMRMHGRGEGEVHGRGHMKGEQMRPMISAAPPQPEPVAPPAVHPGHPRGPVVVQQPQPVPQPGTVVVPGGNQEHGKGPGGGGPPGQEKEKGNGKGHGKDQ